MLRVKDLNVLFRILQSSTTRQLTLKYRNVTIGRHIGTIYGHNLFIGDNVVVVGFYVHTTYH